MKYYFNEDKSVRLYNGDCLDVMDKLIEAGVKVDAIITDIPYGTTNCKWDSVLDLSSMWESLYKIKNNNRTPIVLFAQTPFDKVLGVSNLKDLRYEWIWEKTQATGHLNAKKMPMKAHENVLVFYEKLPTYNPQKTQNHKPVNSYTKYISTQNNTEIYGKVNREIKGGGETDRFPRSVVKFANDKQKSCLHPTQKPLELMKYLVNTYSDEGDTILDFTMGSGTTGVACKELGRNFIGIELDEKYFDIAVERIKD